MNLVFLGFFLSSSLLAQSIPGTEEMTCPGEGFVVAYTSPTTKKHVQKCMVKVNGEIVDQESAPVAATPQAPKQPDPKYAKAIQHLLKILSRQTLNDSLVFKVETCEKSPMKWIGMALSKKPANFIYIFKEGCDVEGTFTANFGESFPLVLKLRNLMDFNQTKMDVLQVISKGSRGVLLNFKATNGKLESAADKVDYEAWYEIEINPMNGQAYLDTQKGEITIKNINGEAINMKEKLYY